MVKFLLPQLRLRARASDILTVAVTMSGGAKTEGRRCRATIFKILVKFDLLEFDENSRRIRVDFAQKRRFIANDSFKPVC